MRFFDTGDRVRIVGMSSFKGCTATVVANHGIRVYVLIDGEGDNPVPFNSAELRA